MDDTRAHTPTPGTPRRMDDHRFKMRKGTRSCLECRRRKIRCTFDPGARTCKECAARGSECKEQVRIRPPEPRISSSSAGGGAGGAGSAAGSATGSGNGSASGGGGGGGPGGSDSSRADLRRRVAQLEKTVEIMSSLVATSTTPREVSAEFGGMAGSGMGMGMGMGMGAGARTGPGSGTGSGAGSGTPGEAGEGWVRRGVVGGGGGGGGGGEQSDEDGDEEEDSEFGHDGPSLALFEGAGFSKTSSATPDDRSASSHRLSVGSAPSRPRSKRAHLRQSLLALLPSREDLNVILTTGDAWWSRFRPLGPFHIMPQVRRQPLMQFVLSLFEQDNPLAVSLGLLCVGIAAYQLPPEIEQSLQRSVMLCIPCKQLFQQYMSVIESLVLSDDYLMRSLGGIEITACQMHFHMVMGQPRKSWVCLRKAISVAQLLGLHKNRPLESQTTICAIWESIWPTMCTVDRYLSLMLGLPYAVPDSLIPEDVTNLAIATDNSQETLRYTRTLTYIAGAVIDRNERPGPPSHELTLEIDQKMEALINSMPPAWFQPSRTGELVAHSEADLHERIAAQFWHHQIRAFLHLPFLLMSETAPAYAYSRATCLAAARASLEQYQALRQRPDAAFAMLKIADFQGFTAGVLVLLGLLGYDRASNSVGVSEQDSALAQHDSVLIERTLSIFRQAATEPGNSTAVQALQGLETLCAARELSQGSQWTGKVVVPYFGTITLSSTRLPAPNHHVLGGGQIGPEQPLFTSPSMAMQAMTFDEHDSTRMQGASGNLDMQSFETLMMQGYPYVEVNWNGLLSMDLDQDWSQLTE